MPGRSPRVGYVNVNGLDGLKRKACLKLLHTFLDFLFLAEVWFVSHARYSRDRRFVASTPLPPPSLLRTRTGGGMYLLASASARGRIVGDVEVTPSTVSFKFHNLIFSGVYLRPSMPREDVLLALRSVASSTIILGDVNARLPWLRTQAGRPRPPERVDALADFTRSYGLTTPQSQPSSSTPASSGLPTKATLVKSLTVDHCFVKTSRTADATLTLLDNASMCLSTDHAYTLHLRLGSRPDSAIPSAASAYPPLRYRPENLSDERVSQRMCAAFDEGPSLVV